MQQVYLWYIVVVQIESRLQRIVTNKRFILLILNNFVSQNLEVGSAMVSLGDLPPTRLWGAAGPENESLRIHGLSRGAFSGTAEGTPPGVDAAGVKTAHMKLLKSVAAGTSPDAVSEPRFSSRWSWRATSNEQPRAGPGVGPPPPTVKVFGDSR